VSAQPTAPRSSSTASQRHDPRSSPIRTKQPPTWTSIDRQLTNNAVWVPTVNEREVDLVSKRLRNYEYNPVWGFLADQGWLG